MNRGCVRNLKTWVPFYSDLKVSWLQISEVAVANVHNVRDLMGVKCILLKFVGAMVPTAPMLTHPLFKKTITISPHF